MSDNDRVTVRATDLKWAMWWIEFAAGPERERLRAALDPAPAEPTAEDEAESAAEFDRSRGLNLPREERARIAREQSKGAPVVERPSPREASTPDDERAPAVRRYIEENGPESWNTEPARPSLPDTPWTTVRVTLDDDSTRVWKTMHQPRAWNAAFDGRCVEDEALARVTSFTRLAEPPKSAYERGYDDGSAAHYAPESAEQGDTGSDETGRDPLSPIARFALNEAKAAEDRAHDHVTQAQRQALTYTDRKVAELRAEIVAALLDAREDTVKFGDMQDVADALADGESGGEG